MWGRHWLFVLGTASALTGRAFAMPLSMQGGAGLQSDSDFRSSVDALGLTPDLAVGPIESVSTPAPSAITLHSAGLVWSYSVTAEGRRASNVSIGDHGSALFADFGGANGSQRLLSAFDDATPSPVWESSRAFQSWGSKVASADSTITHAVLNFSRTADGAPSQAILSKYTCASEIPDWTYTFHATINVGDSPHAGVGVSRDGKTIVAWLFKTNPKETLVTAFNADSGIPISESSLPTAFEPRTSKLSADASTLLVVTGDRTWVFDVPKTTILQYDVNWLGAGSGSAVSADGSTYVKSLSDKEVEVYRLQGSNYVLESKPTLEANWQCGQAALSDDGSMLACVWANMINLTDVRVQVYELHGSAVTLLLDKSYAGVGTFKNIPMDLAMAADGSTIAVGLSGDEGDTVPELQAFHRDAQTGAWSNVLTYDFPGTVWDLDLSTDGLSLAVASSSNHLNEGGMGGDVSYFTLSPRDLVVEGVPRAGATVYIHQYVNAGADGGLYVAPAVAAKPRLFPGIGTLQLQRSTLSFTSLMTAGTNGIVTRAVTLPSSVSDVGSTTYYQGLDVNPLRLSESWISLTVLP